MPVDGRSILLICVLMLLSGAASPRSMQPEDELLDAERFRGELMRRGMTDLLEAFLEECPPTRPVDKLIYARQQQLAIYADKSRDEDECLAALDKAIVLLSEAVEKHPNDPRAMEWRLALGKDLIYKQAEPYYNNILFRGGSKEDRARLLAISTRATETFDALIKVIERWDRDAQHLSESELRRLDNTGELDRRRELDLNARYFASWAKFYRALAAPPGKDRQAVLDEIITYLTVEKKDWIETDHAQSGVQCQSLLLLGMTYRLKGDQNADEQAVKYLRQAVERAAKLTDPGEKRDLQWVVFLGKMEQIKVQRDTGQYAEALASIKAMTQEMADAPSSPSTELAAALLEGSIYRKQAEAAKAKKNVKTYTRLMAQSRQPLIALANRRPQAKARIYASIYPLLGKDPKQDELGPFDKNVYVVGLLNDAARAQRRVEQIRKAAAGKLDPARRKQIVQLNAERTASLAKAIQTAELLLADKSELAERLRPEALFNLAVCCFESGKLLRAVQTFDRLARDFPAFNRSRDAASHAVQIAADLNRDPANSDRPEIRQVFIEALRTLTGRFADSDEARYWQFFLANTIELAGDDRAAAEAYAKVSPDHAHYLDARYYRMGCLRRSFERAVASQPADEASVRRQAEKLLAEATDCANLIAKSVDQIDDKKRQAELEQFAGDALLTIARLTNEPPLQDYQATMKTLAGFEDRYGRYRDLIGRSMRLKIVALQGLDRLDQAKQLIPDYVRRDPENAGATLGALLTSMRQEVERARQRDQDKAARKAAAESVELAVWLYRWARVNRQRVKPDELFAIRVQLAQAYLEAGQYEPALKLFQECFEQDKARSSEGEPSHGPTLIGLAESHYRLAQQAAKAGQYDRAAEGFQTASRRFMVVWQRTERHTPLWWRAFVRGLQVPVERREVLVAQLEQARRSRSLTDQERGQLASIPKILARIEQTINAERMGDTQLGGHTQALNLLRARMKKLAKRVRDLGM